MDSRDAQRALVLRSNAPTEICPDFNNGIDCKDCLGHHVCSTCHQIGHSACQCTAHNNDTDLGNCLVSTATLDSGAPKPSGNPYDFDNLQIYTAEAAISRGRPNDEFPLPHPDFRRALLFFRSDGSEWNSESYRKYRDKQKSVKEKNKHNPWTDDIEAAFQKGNLLWLKL